VSKLKLWEVGPDLYISAVPRTGDADVIREAGITSIYCMSKMRTDEEVIESVQKWEYCHVPDGKKVPEAQLRHVVTSALSDLKEGHVVLIHCLGGRNRSMLAAALVERARNYWSGLEAWDHAMIIRRGSLKNPVTAEWLRNLPELR